MFIGGPLPANWHKTSQMGGQKVSSVVEDNAFQFRLQFQVNSYLENGALENVINAFIASCHDHFLCVNVGQKNFALQMKH